LVIGDEILKGRTPDTNLQAAALALRKHNVVLNCAVTVLDDLEEICHEIRRLQQQVDVIITSGGVGPTHDDVTIKSVAAALSCDMVLHEEMAELLRDKMNQKKDENSSNTTDHKNNATTATATTELTDAQKKMAMLPSRPKLRYLSETPNDWPVLQCRNIFILPGILQLFAKKVQDVAEYLSCQLERSVAFRVVLSVDENSIVPILNKVVENHPSVTLGSYPFVGHPEYKTVITVEDRMLPCCGGGSGTAASDTERNRKDSMEGGGFTGKELMDQNVQLALDELIHDLPQGSVLRVENDDNLLSDD